LEEVWECSGESPSARPPRARTMPTDWAIYPEVQIKAIEEGNTNQSGFTVRMIKPKEKVVAEIVDIAWAQAHGEDAGDLIGDRFYFDAATWYSKGFRRKLDVLIRVEPKKAGIPIFLYHYDVDDTTEAYGGDNLIDIHETNPATSNVNWPDNIGGPVLEQANGSTEATQDETGEIRLHWSVNENVRPGDNVRLVAVGLPSREAGCPSALSHVAAMSNEPETVYYEPSYSGKGSGDGTPSASKQSGSGPRLMYDKNGNNMYDGGREDITEAPNLVNTPALTVWRTLHLYTGQMGPYEPWHVLVAGRKEAKVTAPLGYKYEDIWLTSTALANDYRDSAERGILSCTSGGHDYNLHIVSSGNVYPYLSDVRVRYKEGDVLPAVGTAVDFYDDDWLRWAIGESIPKIPTTQATNAFARAFVSVVVIPWTEEIPFVMNVEEAPRSTGYATVAQINARPTEALRKINTPQHWVAYIASAFQPPLRADLDPVDEGSLGGDKVYRGITYHSTLEGGSVLFCETALDSVAIKSPSMFPNIFDAVVLHELGHQVAGLTSSDRDERNDTTYDAFDYYNKGLWEYVAAGCPRPLYTKYTLSKIRNMEKDDKPCL
jgi:hypothetical protein